MSLATAATAALALAALVASFTGCGDVEKVKEEESEEHTQTIMILTQGMGTEGIAVRIEYYRDASRQSALRFADANGDGVIDAKAGPKEGGGWPSGWDWLDGLFDDVAVDKSTLSVSGEEVVIEDGVTYELSLGEWDCGPSEPSEPSD